MIKFIKGNIVERELDYIVLENNNMGYKINTSRTTISDYFAIDEGELVLMNTEMVVREDDISIYGFSTKDELKVFNMLRTVSRVGAKSVIKILSEMHYLEIVQVIKDGDHKTLTKAKGVGAKTAMRIIVELKDKMEKEFSNISGSNIINKVETTNNINEDALMALMALGYTEKDSKSVLMEFDNDGLTVEDVLKKALQYF